MRQRVENKTGWRKELCEARPWRPRRTRPAASPRCPCLRPRRTATHAARAATQHYVRWTGRRERSGCAWRGRGSHQSSASPGSAPVDPRSCCAYYAAAPRPAPRPRPAAPTAPAREPATCLCPAARRATVSVGGLGASCPTPRVLSLAPAYGGRGQVWAGPGAGKGHGGGTLSAASALFELVRAAAQRTAGRRQCVTRPVGSPTRRTVPLAIGQGSGVGLRTDAAVAVQAEVLALSQGGVLQAVVAWEAAWAWVAFEARLQYQQARVKSPHRVTCEPRPSHFVFSACWLVSKDWQPVSKARRHSRCGRRAPVALARILRSSARPQSLWSRTWLGTPGTQPGR